jgi:magnesium chelatase family protein
LGVLFLDELPEFQRATLEALRQPIETGRVMVARANAHVSYPARFQLVAAMNPCKCGHLGDRTLGCSRQPRCAEDYQARISGPLFDRIDLHVDVPAVAAADLSLPPPAEGSAQVAARVAAAREAQTERYAMLSAGGNGGGHGVAQSSALGVGEKTIRTNADIDGELLEKFAAPDPDGRRLLTEAADKFRLTARGYHRVLRVARTLADLDGKDAVRRLHVAEALSYRRVAPGR